MNKEDNSLKTYFIILIPNFLPPKNMVIVNWNFKIRLSVIQADKVFIPSVQRQEPDVIIPHDFMKFGLYYGLTAPWNIIMHPHN